MKVSRRQFLTGVSATAIAAAAPSPGNAQPVVMGFDFGSGDKTVVTVMKPDGPILEMYELHEKMRRDLYAMFDISDVITEG